MKIVINILGENGEFQSSIAVDGEKGSILYADSNSIIGKQGRAIVNISNDTNKNADSAQCACNHAKTSECI